MKIYTDGVLIIEVGSKYAYVLTRVGGFKIGQADITDGSYLKHMERAGFKETNK